MHPGIDRARTVPPLATFELRGAAFRAHPGFTSATAAYCAEMIKGQVGTWPTVKLFNQFGRYMVSFLLIHQYQEWLSHRGPVPTLKRLQACGNLSSRQVANIIAGLRAGRLLTSTQAEGGRGRALTPTPELTAAISHSMLAFIRAADRLEGFSRAPRLEANPSLQNELIHRSAEFVFTYGTLLAPFPRVRHFTMKDCGYLVLVAVMAAAYASAGEAPSLSYTSLARRFRVSRSHIGNLIADGAREQWFTTDGHGQLKSIDRGFIDEFERWAAAELGHYAVIADQMLVREPGADLSLAGTG